jgi:hypothetical protein
MKKLALLMLVAFGTSILLMGCGSEPELAPGDSMENTLKDAQKSATPDEGKGKRSMSQVKTEKSPDINQ